MNNCILLLTEKKLKMLESAVAFLIMLNPFALFIYLTPVMKDLDNKQFVYVLLKASFISFVTYLVFMVSGEFLFNTVFQIKYESFRIFGGIVIFSFAFQYIVRGEKSLIQLKESLDDLASEIALPFMVGAGSISLSIMMGYKYDLEISVLLLLAVLLVNFLTIVFLKWIKDQLSRRMLRIAFDKNMNILLRLNGFFIGAIGIDMIINGIIALVQSVE